MKFNDKLLEQLKEYDVFPELGNTWEPDIWEHLSPSKEGYWNEKYEKVKLVTKIVFYCKETIYRDALDKEYNLSKRVAISIKAGAHSAFSGSNSRLSTYKIFEEGEWTPNSLREFIEKENERIFNNLEPEDDPNRSDNELREAFYNSRY